MLILNEEFQTNSLQVFYNSLLIYQQSSSGVLIKQSQITSIASLENDSTITLQARTLNILSITQ